MANEKIIIEVGLSNAEYAQKAVETAKSIEDLKNRQKELKKAGQETSLEFLQNKQRLQELNAETKAYTLLSSNSTSSAKALRAELAILSNQWAILSQEERENSEEGKVLTERINAINDKLREQESGVGNFKRFIGDYKTGVADLKDELAALIVQQQKLTEEEKKGQAGQDIADKIRNTTEAIKQQTQELELYENAQKQATEMTTEFSTSTDTLTESLTDSIAQMVPFGDQVNGAIGNFKNLTSGITSGTSSLQSFKVALASTGIGVLLLAVGALLNYLSKYKPLLDWVEQKTAGVKVVFEALGEVLFKVGEALFNAFENPKQAIKDLGNSIQTNIINRFKAFAVMWDALKTGNIQKLADGFIQLNTGIEDSSSKLNAFIKETSDAAKAEAELVKQQQDLDDEVRKSIPVVAELKRQQAELLLQSKNRTLSEEERIKKLNGVIDIDKQILAINLKQAEAQYAITKAKNDRLDKQGRLSDEEHQKEMEQLAAITNLRTESVKIQEKAFNQQDALAQKAEERRKAAMEKEKAAREAAEKELQESLIRSNQLLLTERQREIDDLTRNYEEKIKLHKKYGQTTTQLQKEFTAQIAAINKKFLEEDLKQIQANAEAVEDLVISRIENQGVRELKQLEVQSKRKLAAYDDEIKAVKERIAQGEQGLTELLQSKQALRDEYETTAAYQRLEKQKEIGQQEIDEANRIALEKLEAAQIEAKNPVDELLAREALLEAKYQQDIDNAIRTGQDITLIRAKFAEDQENIEKEKNKLALDSYNAFSEGFQKAVGENTLAAKIAGDVQMRVNTALALSNNLVAATEQIRGLSAQAKLPFPYNIVAMLSTLSTIVTVISQVKSLVKMPTAFADGGVYVSDGMGSPVRGPGNGTSDSINAKLSNGESVINARSTKMFWPLLSAINQIGGGRSFGGTTSTTAFAGGGVYDGGTTASYVTYESNTTNDVTNGVLAAIQNVKIVASVEDIITGVDNKIEVTERVNI